MPLASERLASAQTPAELLSVLRELELDILHERVQVRDYRVPRQVQKPWEAALRHAVNHERLLSQWEVFSSILGPPIARDLFLSIRSRAFRQMLQEEIEENEYEYDEDEDEEEEDDQEEEVEEDEVEAPQPAVVPTIDATGLNVGMASEALVAWAARYRVTDMLDLSCDNAVNYYSIEAMVYRSAPRRPTVREALLDTAPLFPTRSKSEARAALAGRDAYARVVRDWLVVRATEVATATAAATTTRARHREPADARVATRWRAMLALRDEVAAAVTPLSARNTGPSFTDDPPAFYLNNGAHGCAIGSHAHRTSLSLEADTPTIKCECGRARCPSMLHLLDDALQWISGTLTGKSNEKILIALVTQPWERTLAELDRLPTGAEERDGQLGWRVATRPLRVAPVRCTPKKNGGLKIVRAHLAEAQSAVGPTGAIDRLVADSLPDADYSTARVARAVERLVGHPRVFFDDRGERPIQIRAATLGFRLVAAEGGARLLVTTGEQAVDAPWLFEQAERAGDRLIRWDPTTRVLHVIRAPNEVYQLSEGLARRGSFFPDGAIPDLIRRLPSLSRVAPVASGEMVEELPADPRWLVRLEVLSADLLHVSAHVRPRPDLAPQVPGEPPLQVFTRAANGVASVRRDLPGEVAEVQSRLTTVPLGLPQSEEPFTWSITEPEQTLDVLQALQTLQDVDIEWIGPKKRVTTANASALRIQVGSAKEWFAVGGALDVDGVELSMARLLEAIAARRAFVKVDEHTWLRLENTFRERLEPVADAAEGGSLSAVNAPLLVALEDAGAAIQAPPRWMQVLDRVRAAPTYLADVPDGLNAELRPYQVEGFQWLARLATWAEGAVLADDMGLGKTVQTLALLLHRASEGPALVVAPTSVGFNWIRQAERFAPTLKIRLARGADRPRAGDTPGPGDVIVTSYDLLVRDLDVLSTFEFGTIVLDEAQAVKNPDTLRAKAVRALKGAFRVGLSGTPLENRTGELWSLFAAVAPGVLGSRERFRNSYALPIERDGDVERRRALARRIRPFVLRRLKSEVAKDLPSRTEIRVDVDLSASERGLYDAARALAIQELGAASVPEQQRRFQVLAALTRLRQLACHPRLIDAESTDTSSKMEVLVDLLRELRDQHRRTLVFSQFVRQLHLVRDRLASEGFRLRYLDGSTAPDERRAEVDAFQRGDGDVFLLSLKAGGTGIDLTAASDVVILDPWWNPAVEDQAADRAHRIGQTQAVTIYRLVARETVEERIIALHADKRDLVSAVLEGTGGAAALSADELLELLSEPVSVAGGRAPKATRTAVSPPTLGVIEGGLATTRPVATEEATGPQVTPPKVAAIAPKASAVASEPSAVAPKVAAVAPKVAVVAPKVASEPAAVAPKVAAAAPSASAVASHPLLGVKDERASAPVPKLTIAAWTALFMAEVERDVTADALSASSGAVYRSGARRVLPRLAKADQELDRAQICAALEKFRAEAAAGRISATSSEIALASTIASRLRRG